LLIDGGRVLSAERSQLGQLCTPAFGDRIFVSKEFMREVALYCKQPPLSWCSDATEGPSQPRQSPAELKPAALAVGASSLDRAPGENQTSRSRELKQTSDAAIRDEIRLVNEPFITAGQYGPNINKLADEVQARLEQKGFYASQNSIKKIGDEAEFKACRRPPGRTLASERKQK
jgi:hypothetical protein